MPLPSYTVVLYSVLGSTVSGTQVLPPPTTGTTWVLRDICFYMPTAAGWLPVIAQARLTVDGIEVAATPAYRTIANTLYETRDLRQTVSKTSSVALVATATGWHLQVTGYAFSS